ncbi:autotransporter domain-containing protein [Sphingomonas sp. BGYR3]|uniref:autotransporter domain-containing protein n=1 Tax=Sphingomonas sp. BGYR3 TaxID=2975483 RepID=UPI0021A414DF|nr:autotransporter domain-containing protein [Sphingomonas sp. BGYR3]MDG5487899.1 autotransporter domain-containing protein [Sphingomonas sp. BGYR3]
MILARTTRASLLLSAAGLGLCAMATPAMAGDSDTTPGLELVSIAPDATGGRPDLAIESAHRVSVAPAVQQQIHVVPDDAEETPQITINNNFTPVQAYDPTNITGVGQIISDSGGGFIGTCTGSLINPRTVIFAAHCVNTRSATAYGANSGGVAVGIGFETNTRANAPGQVDELVRWLLGSGPTQAGRFQTNTAQAFYNINQVFYDPRSLSAASCTTPTSCFLEADVATAVLDTPAKDIPTWALLFSPLPTPGAIDPVNGTGYHVNIAGYGAFGNGTTGSASNGNFRRRAAENMLGALTSFNSRNTFLFGSPGAISRPQQLYFLDFDDPARGTPAANTRDFNGFRDNALTREGTTGPGDSGGPLILDRTFSKQVVIGVLSGGSTFFAGQPGGSYGTQSFYQPLFLYWDWIVANNPYRYVSAVGGNVNWENAAAWVTELDPNYQIISNGQLVNGVPTNLGGANSGNGPEFGEACFQSPNTSTNPATNECVDLSTGRERNGIPNRATDTNAPAVTQVVGEGDLVPGLETAQATPGYSDTARPAATIANGLPGATNFVPNNVDGVRTTGQIGRYFDVTLRNTGNVTLNSTVTIDRFTIQGATSQLTIASNASLTSLMEIRQNTGTIVNNGILASQGDFLFLSGLLTGSGRINAPFTTSVMGTIAPGTIGTTGTLTIGGNLILTSGSQLLIDLGPNGVSDRIALVAGSGQTGQADLGGTVGFSTVGGYRPADGDVFTILTATGGITGRFAATAPLSAILTPRILYGTTAVQVEIEAGRYADVINAASPIQRAYASLLDTNRGNTAVSAELYRELDLLGAPQLRDTLETLAPNAAQLSANMGIVLTDTLSRFYRDRMGTVARGGTYGSIAMYGRPVQLASLATMNPGGAQVQSDSGNGMSVQQGALPDDVAVYLAGGYVEGSGQGLPGAVNFGRNRFDGYYIAGGIEKDLGGGTLGIGISYADMDGRIPGGAQLADAALYQGTLYGTLGLGKLAALDGVISVGSYDTTTQRNATLGAVPFTLRSKDQATAVSAELGLGGVAPEGQALSIMPRVALRYNLLDFDDVFETGGGPALRYNLGKFESWQARGGVTLTTGAGSVRPFASAQYVYDFGERPGAFGVNLIGGRGPSALLALAGTDNDWGEVTGGLVIDTGNIAASFSAESTVNRSDVRNQAYRASLTVRF